MPKQLRPQNLTPTNDERPRTAPRSSRPDAGSTHLADVLGAAAAGDDAAWEVLVQRFTPALQAAARGFRLSPADVDDVVQNTWLAAFRHVRRVERPEALGAWLLVTARREALRILQRSVREVVTEEPLSATATDDEPPEQLVLEAERGDELEAAIGRLPAQHRKLLRTLMRAPDASYGDIAERLAMPVGSIGPTRARALERLREDRRLADLLRSDPTI